MNNQELIQKMKEDMEMRGFSTLTVFIKLLLTFPKNGSIIKA